MDQVNKYSTTTTTIGSRTSGRQQQQQQQQHQQLRSKRELFAVFLFIICYCSSSSSAVLAFSTPPTTTTTTTTASHRIMTMKTNNILAMNNSNNNSNNKAQKLGNNSNNNNKSRRTGGVRRSHGGGGGIPLRPGSSSLEMIRQNQQEEFELNVGHAMDVLRKDYTVILTQNPDFSIYDQNLELIDPSGVHLAGVKNYKAAFALLHAVVGIFYCPDRSLLTFRMCYDKARQNVRISWNAEVIPKAIFGGQKSTLHVDGISVYEFSQLSGNITQHRIERLVINDTPIVPEDGIFAALRGHAVDSQVDGIPVFNSRTTTTTTTTLIGGGTTTTTMAKIYHHQNQQVLPFRNFSPVSTRSVLFSTDDTTTNNNNKNSNNNNKGGRRGDKDHASSSSPSSSSTQLSAVSGSDNGGGGDELERKNAARKKFGLPPLTPEEFAELQEQVSQLDAQQQQRAASAAAEMAAKKKKEEAGGFFKKLFGNALDNTCESNYDCQRPEVCCDFGFKKMCCTSGMRVLDGPQSRKGQLAEVPVIANPGPNYPDLDPGRF